MNDGIERALRQAREAAGGRDVRIAGGAHTIQQYLNAGLVDEFHVAVAPVLLRAGLRLFDRIEQDRVAVIGVESLQSPRITHLRYAVKRK